MGGGARQRLVGGKGHPTKPHHPPFQEAERLTHLSPMGTSVTFDGDDGHVRSTLVGAHRDRHSAGRQRTKDKKETVAKLREQGRTAHADRLDEAHTRRTHAAIQRARRQDEIQAKRRWGPIRAKANELPKVSGKLRRARYNREDFGTGGIREPVCVGPRDLYVQFIPRGLKSGSSRNYKDGKPKPAGNRSPWKSGETADKIQYICREEALEDLPGAVISNMGNNLRERVACAMAIEKLEELGRVDAGVYRHVIIALPHELAPEERVALLNRLMKPVGDLKLPFTASLHKPDKDGDDRNYHAHIVLSLRPFERNGPVEWEFATSKLTWIETPAAHLLIRRHVAREFNRALKKAKVETRWTHLSRAARSEPSPGNTKRHRSDIRGDRALEAALKGEQTAKRHLRLVAVVQSSVEALRAEAAGLVGAAVSRSAFLGRVIDLIEGAAADQTGENRRQRDERMATLEKKVAAEVAAEALRTRHRGRDDLDPDAPVRSPSLAPLVDHFREDRQVQTALAHKLGVESNPAKLRTLDRQPPKSANAESPSPLWSRKRGEYRKPGRGRLWTSFEARHRLAATMRSPPQKISQASLKRPASRPRRLPCNALA